MPYLEGLLHCVSIQIEHGLHVRSTLHALRVQDVIKPLYQQHMYYCIHSRQHSGIVGACNMHGVFTGTWCLCTEQALKANCSRNTVVVLQLFN